VNKYLSFDIEIYNELPENFDPKEIIPSVAAIGTCEDDIEYYYDIPHMSKSTAVDLVETMIANNALGIRPVAWNGTHFDFPILGFWSGMVEECADLAMQSIDLMLLVTFRRGHFLGLQKALDGAGLKGKLKKVTLKDGTPINDMTGAKAPQLWRDGEHEAVIAYLKEDIIQPLELIDEIVKNRGIKWISGTGRASFCRAKLTPVYECYKWDKSEYPYWLKNPVERDVFFDWMPESILKKYGIGS